MARTIEFDVERIFRKLNVLEGTQIKYAAKRSLQRFGFEAQQHLGLQMAGRFENPVSYTLSSARYDPKIIEDQGSVALRLYINPDGSGGTAPATYLYPTDRGSGDSTAYTTRFGKGLSKIGVTNKFPVPYAGGKEVRTNKYGNMLPSQYRETLRDLQTKGSTIFALPNGFPGGLLPPGIYKRRGRSAYLLFSLLDRPPQVRQAFDFYGITQRLAQQRLPKLIGEELAKALR
jgi:hypothetical protein